MISDEQAKRIFLEMGFHLLPREWAQIRLYMDLLLKWNRRVNLTRIIEEGAICQEHFGESFYMSQRLPLQCQTVLDVGSGAGFPGLALKIRRPQLRLTLVESSGKKACFLDEVARQLGWKHEVEIKNARWEDWARSTGAKYDAITVRGVKAGPELMSSWASHLMPQGRLLLSTSSDQAEKLAVSGQGFRWTRDRGFFSISRREILIGERCFT